MEKKCVVPMWVSVVLVILAVTAMVFCIAGLLSGDKPTATIVSSATDCLLAVFALIYCFTGYKKASAVFFRIFCFLFILDKSMAFFTPHNVTSFGHVYNVAFSLIMFGAICVLTFAKDLGKKKSLYLSGLVLVSTLAVFVYLANCFTINSLEWAINIINAVILGIMVYAKYQDKAARGAK